MLKLYIIMMLVCNLTWFYCADFLQTKSLQQETSIILPEKYQKLELQKCSLTLLEKQFTKQFPGIIETYQHPTGVIIFRQVTGATRKLHNSRTCLKSSGFKLSEPKTEEDHEGVIWQIYTAENKEATLVVRSVILSRSDDETWPSVEEWFWDAFFTRSDKTYLAITEIRDQS